MGSHWLLQVAGRFFSSGRNYVPDQLMLVFTDDDLQVNVDRYMELNADWDQGLDRAAPRGGLFVYRTTVAALRARLAIQGFSEDRVRQEAIGHLVGELESAHRPEEGDVRWLPSAWRHESPDAATAAVILARLLSWLKSGGRDSPPPTEDETERWLGHYWEDLCRFSYDDPRFSLALGIIGLAPSAAVRLDLTDPLLGGYLEIDQRPHSTARRRLASEIASSGPIIVITEGSSDARILEAVLARHAPSVRPFFSFLEFARNGLAGGTDRVANLTRGIAAAGVSNRVVAVLDNDAAGRDAQRVLERVGLPPNITVTRLPDVPYGNRYPNARDSSGARVELNLNGTAVSIEVSFGLDILKSVAGGRLPVVKVGGLVPGVQVRQGSLEGPVKRRVQQEVLRLLAGEVSAAPPRGVVAGCRRLVAMLVGSAADAYPMMMSEYSDLVEGRAQV